MTCSATAKGYRRRAAIQRAPITVGRNSADDLQ